MKIKSIEDFTLEECEEYLRFYPDGQHRAAVEERIRNMHDDKQNKDVKWIDVKQFLSKHDYYKDKSRTIIIVSVTLLFALFLFIASCHFSITEYEYTTDIERLLLNINLIEKGWDDTYDMTGLNFLVVLVISILIIWLGSSLESHSPSLKTIYNIEKIGHKEFRLTQNREGKFGLHYCGKRRIVTLLPFIYDNIYYCGEGCYICVKGNKRGVYNADMKKMVIELEYDNIDMMQDGNLRTMRNGVVSKFTKEGYRVIE